MGLFQIYVEWPPENSTMEHIFVRGKNKASVDEAIDSLQTYGLVLDFSDDDCQSPDHNNGYEHDTFYIYYH